MQALHRVRERLVRQRLAMTNQIRGLLLDRGIEIAQGFYALRTVLPKLVADEATGLTPMMRELMRILLLAWNQTEQAIEALNAKIGELARESELCRRLQSIPGVGPLLATAIVAAVGNGSEFRRERSSRSVYNKAEYAEQRRHMLQERADMVDAWIEGWTHVPKLLPANVVVPALSVAL